MLRQDIETAIKQAISRLKEFSSIPPFLSYAEKEKTKGYGDYSSSICFEMAKILKESPKDIAETLKQELINSKEGKEMFERVEVINGFLNFFLKSDYLSKNLKHVLKEKDKFGNDKTGKGIKIQVEFISANPTGPLTIGNARGGFYGDVLCNVLEKAGFKTERAYYINDYGMQILSLGHSILKDSEAKYKGEYIDKLKERIKEKDPYKAGKRGAEIIMNEMIKKTVKNMGIHFDEWFKESELYKSKRIDKALELLEKKGLIYQKEGALFFKSTEFRDERDRVAVKSNKEKTYLMGDISYHRYKFEEKKFNKVINIWGADHFGDIKGLMSGVEALGHKGKLKIVILQHVTLIENGEIKKMSKREGVYVTVDELLEEVGIDVSRFFFLQKSPESHLNFDLSLAKEQSEKNPVFYVQYAYARICSVLRKAKKKGLFLNFNKLVHPSELNLMKQILRFEEIVKDTVIDYGVQRIPQYALDLASSFHQFYADCKVINDDKELEKQRLGLVNAAKIVIKNTLQLMGISSPETM